MMLHARGVGRVTRHPCDFGLRRPVASAEEAIRMRLLYLMRVSLEIKAITSNAGDFTFLP